MYLKTLYRQIGQYKTASVLTPVFTALEVVMDVLIPYATAMLIDRGIMAGDMQQVWLYGGVMIGMALLSLLFGIVGGRMASYASTGFAANLRSAMYRNIQTFAFADIDKYSTSGLVTRMTTDVSNLQNAFQQILRVTVRAPFRLVLSVVMCLVIDARLSLIFVTALVVLSVSLYLIISRVARLFTQVFEQYDRLNLSVQENTAAIRVVKAFVREDYENAKFARAAEGLYKLYVRAESLMALNHPVMNLVVYGCIIALSWWGAQFIVGGTLTTGELTSLFTYVMSILMSLMMLSMVFVMLTQSAASGQRVAEVIDEQASITSPTETVVNEVSDGSIEFRNVRFDYNTADASPNGGRMEGAIGSVVSSTGFFFEALKILPATIPLFGFQRVPFIARVKEYGRSAHLLGYKPQLGIAVEHLQDAEPLRQQIEHLFNTPVELLGSHYEVSLTNSNPLLHTSRLYSMWHDWHKGIVYPTQNRFYADWTDEASQLLIDMDREFFRLLAVLPVRPGSIPTILDYYESHDAASLTRKLRSIPAFRDILSPMKAVEGGFIPDFQSRYFTEDFPYGLAIIRRLLQEHHIDAPHIEMVYQWGCSLGSF